MSFELTINGAQTQFDSPVTIADIIDARGLPLRGIAVSVNGALWPKARWDELVPPCSELDILTAVQGG